MDYLLVGTIVKTVGLKGEVKIYPTTHFRGSRFKKGSHVFLKKDDTYIEIIVKTHRENGEMDIVSFEGYNTIESVESLIKKDLFVIKDVNFLNKNEYFYVDLEGCKVSFDNGKEIGTVSRIEEYSSYATLRINANKKDVLVPFVKAFIKDVDIKNKLITIFYIEGLIWK